MNALVDGKYRYWLKRSVFPARDAHGTMVFVMLNPSTADAIEDDPTIRRCLGFARREGLGRLLVLNLFAYRATNPRDLHEAEIRGEAVGPRNDEHIRGQLLGIGRDAGMRIVVAAWGSHGSLMDRDQEVLRGIKQAGHFPMCLGTTKFGLPRHPLYLRADAALTPYGGRR